MSTNDEHPELRDRYIAALAGYVAEVDKIDQEMAICTDEPAWLISMRKTRSNVIGSLDRMKVRALKVDLKERRGAK